jgi:hypothetical protein
MRKTFDQMSRDALKIELKVEFMRAPRAVPILLCLKWGTFDMGFILASFAKMKCRTLRLRFKALGEI